jgi:predicted nucleic acid-binding protein
MTDVTLDTGALIRLQRDRTLSRALLRAARSDGVRLRTTAPALTEFVGGSTPGRRPAAEWVMSWIFLTGVDETAARRAASLMSTARNSSPSSAPSAVDALVAADAERAGGRLAISGDRADFEPLAAASGRFELVDLEDVLR